MALQVLYKTVGKWKENAYLVESGGEAWLLDPGDDFMELDASFLLAGKTLHGIVTTHGHFDHVGAVHDFKEKYKVPFLIHSKDKQLVRQTNLYRRLAGDNTVVTTPSIDGYLDDTSSLELNGSSITVHYTPGHSNGSVSFEIDNCLFSGDVIFQDAIGRTDLPGGNRQLLHQSIVFILDRFVDYTIYPGHGKPFVLSAAVAESLKKML